MKHVLTFTRSCWAVVLGAVIGLGAYGCGDSASVSDEVQVPLSSLTVTPGSLQPAFSSNTTSYIVDVSTTVASIIVTAIPQTSTTTVTINGVDTNSGQGHRIPLSPSGTNTNITIVLTNQNGTESTYNIVVRKVENTLSALTVTPPGAFPPPGFNPNTLSYEVDVDSSIRSVAVSATKLDPRAVMSGSVSARAGVATGRATIPLNGPGTDTLVSITVAVVNSEARTYTITVHQAALSDNNNLSALTVTPGSLNPAFSPGQLTYTVAVATEVTSVDVSATKSDPNAIISGSLPNSGQATIQLNGPGAPTSVLITVTAPNGNSQTYNITVNRAAPASDNNLSALTVMPGTLVPSFDPNTIIYTVEVSLNVENVTVSATKSDPNAVMSGDVTAGTGVPTGEATFQLVPFFPRLVSIEVRAPSGDLKTYTITITRLLF